MFISFYIILTLLCPLYTQINVLSNLSPRSVCQSSNRVLVRLFISAELRWAELLQGAVQGLQLLSHLAQSVLDLTGPIQDVHAAGKGVVAHRKGTLDGCGVPPVRGGEVPLFKGILCKVANQPAPVCNLVIPLYLNAGYACNDTRNEMEWGHR